MNAVRRQFRVPVDRVTVALVALLVAFIAGTVGMLKLFQPITETQASDVTLGAEVIVLAAVEVTILLLAWRGYKRLPQWLKDKIRTVVKGVFFLSAYYMGLIGLYLIAPLSAYAWLIIAPVGFWKLKNWQMNGYTWIIWNLVALGLGVTITRLIAQSVAPIVIVPVMIVAMVYDYVAVNLSDIMGELIEFSTAASIPNFLVIPTTRTLDLEDAIEQIGNGEKPDTVAFMIGLGDFVIPGIFIGSLWVSESGFSLLFAGAVVGVILAALHMRGVLHRREKGLPALPWLM